MRLFTVAGFTARRRARRSTRLDRRVSATSARISAKRLLPEARAAGYTGSARNFRRLVAQAKVTWRAGHHRGRPSLSAS
jgi:hypothetical protein